MLFQAIVALGLPMCHVYTVSGSSLPDKTSVSSLSDQFKLQAKVSSSCWVADTAFGQNRWSFIFSRHKSVGERARPHIQNNLVMGSLLPLDLQSSGTAIHNKRQACGVLRPITSCTNRNNSAIRRIVEAYRGIGLARSTYFQSWVA